MKKTDFFLLCTFTICFFMCSVIMAGDSFYQKLSKYSAKDYFLEQTDCAIISESNKPLSGNTISPEETVIVQTTDVSAAQAATIPDQTPAQDENTYTDQSETILSNDEETDFFQDTLFIGDSRTVGLMEYGSITSADFFADSGMSVFSLTNKKYAFKDQKEFSYKEVLASGHYTKIYLMLGINELGYEFDRLESRYQEVLSQILLLQPDATIYVCANMHVTKAQSVKDKIYNNDNINHVNQMIASLSNNENIIYLDVNPLFDDEEGNLSEEYSSDAFHVFGKHYTEWSDWLREVSK